MLSGGITLQNPSAPKTNLEAWLRSGGMVLGIASVVVTCTVFLYSNFPAIREINALSERISGIEKQSVDQVAQLRADHDSQISVMRNDQRQLRSEAINAQKEVRDELRELRQVVIDRLPPKKYGQL